MASLLALLLRITRRDLAETKARVGDESWVTQSELYRLVQRQLAETAAQLDARCKALAGLQRDNDELRRQFETKQSKEEVCLLVGWAAPRAAIVARLVGASYLNSPSL